MSKSRSSRLVAVVFAVALIGGAGFFMIPYFWAKAVPGYLHDHIGSFLVVDHATFQHFPPRLVLTDVHLKNPRKFGPGDAVKIGRIEALLADYGRSPVAIKSITISNVEGRYILRDGDSNMGIVFKALMDRKRQVPEGEMARQALLGKLYIEDAFLSNEDGTTRIPLETVELEPKGELRKGGTLQHVTTDVLGAVVSQQSDAGAGLVVENIKEKAKNTLRAIGDSIRKLVE